MQTIRLGRTGLDASVAGLGCGGHSRLGMARGASEDEAAKLVREALSLGINFIDTASAYGTEKAVGKGIAGRRDEVILSTKASLRSREGLVDGAGIVASLDKSLVQLGTDHVDIFHIHGLGADQYDYALDEILPALKAQQQLGKIRFLGVTEGFGRDTGHGMFKRALPDDHFDVVMVGFNFLNPSARLSVWPLTIEKDVGTLIMFAVRRALSQPDGLADALAKMLEAGQIDPAKLQGDDVLGFLRTHAAVGSVVEAAYRFCRHEPGAHVILTGTGSVDHLRENVGAILAPPLPADVTAQLESLFGAVDCVSGN